MHSIHIHRKQSISDQLGHKNRNRVINNNTINNNKKKIKITYLVSIKIHRDQTK